MGFEYLMDSWAWLEYFTGSEAGKQVEAVLKQGKVCTTIATIAELSDKFTREGGDVLPYVEYIKAHATVLEITETVAIIAGKIKLELRRRAKDASLFDAIHLATAREQNATLITGDSDFKGIAGAMVVG